MLSPGSSVLAPAASLSVHKTSADSAGVAAYIPINCNHLNINVKLLILIVKGCTLVFRPRKAKEIAEQILFQSSAIVDKSNFKMLYKLSIFFCADIFGCIK